MNISQEDRIRFQKFADRWKKDTEIKTRWWRINDPWILELCRQEKLDREERKRQNAVNS